jgi:putative transcriptional regulator
MANQARADLDVYTIRKNAVGIGYTQGSFAEAIGVPVKTVQNWEQGRRKPTGPARALLLVVARYPKAFARRWGN